MFQSNALRCQIIIPPEMNTSALNPAEHTAVIHHHLRYGLPTTAFQQFATPKTREGTTAFTHF